MQGILGLDIHSTPKGLLEILNEPNRVEKAAIGRHVDEEVEVAVGTRFSSGE